MNSELKEPTQLVAGITHKEILSLMADAGIFCSVDKFTRILQDAQRRALAAQALERMTANAESLNLNDEPKTYTFAPDGSGPCAKQTVTATVVSKRGDRYVATNHCMNPQTVCPRAGMATGQGYELCKSICQQPAHAEVNAILFAGGAAQGASLRLEGHTYACEQCKEVARKYGIAGIVIEEPTNGN
ncbi:cytidine/deoxycytidylate deaminase family protein [Paraburkholderia dilworthii]|uniref:hypothetical protein n=1 Tax=Paraburkholderia dilworthii TaxID=948106 RepID=UPI00048272C2|nr:hypothetical protein [Paraburkholderia dilworthii]